MPAKEATLDEEIKELKRELHTRERVYPDWSKGPNPKLKPDVADHRIACIKSTIARLEKLNAQLKGEQTKLF
jgi:hypothetical protein